jgi:membrane protein
MKMRDRLSASQEQRLNRLHALPLVGLGLRWARRTVEVAMIDRSMGLAAQFVASLIPLLIVLAALAPYRKTSDFWNALARWLGLHGAEVKTIQELIGAGGQLNVDTTRFGVVILVISAFSFIRALQRAYEQVWELSPLSIKNMPRQMLWLTAFLAVLLIGYLIRLVSLPFVPIPLLLAAVFILIGLGFWWLTPYLLLGGRISLRRLLPGAVISWAALVVYARASALYMPGRIDASVHQFGPLGLIFIILSWYFILFCILVAGAAIGPVLLEEDNALARYMRGEDVSDTATSKSEAALPPRADSGH